MKETFTVKCNNCGDERELELNFLQITGKNDIEVYDYSGQTVIKCIKCKNEIYSCW
jgi:ribosomal protein S27E